jgi:hypothetical protein
VPHLGGKVGAARHFRARSQERLSKVNNGYWMNVSGGSKDASGSKAWGVLAVVCLLVAFVNLAIGIVRFGNHESSWFEWVSVAIWIVLAIVCLMASGRIAQPAARKFSGQGNYSQLAKIWTEMGPDLRVRKWLAASLLGLGIGLACLSGVLLDIIATEHSQSPGLLGWTLLAVILGAFAFALLGGLIWYRARVESQKQGHA